MCKIDGAYNVQKRKCLIISFTNHEFIVIASIYNIRWNKFFEHSDWLSKPHQPVRSRDYKDMRFLYQH